jgi:hypothetical protein
MTHVYVWQPQTKQEIRHIRKVTMDKVKELKHSISEDDVRKSTKDVSFRFLCVQLYLSTNMWCVLPSGEAKS